MSQAKTLPEVLTLEEAAAYLHALPAVIDREARSGRIPGRQVEREWRFLRSALDKWLSGNDSRTALLRQAGCFAHDPDLEAMLMSIYAQRGRPEVIEPRG